MELELGLDPDDTARLARLALLTPLKSGKARTRNVRLVWHDSPDRALAAEGLALSQQRPLWRLERLYPNRANWPPGAPTPVLAAGRDRSALGHMLPDPLVPAAAFEGRARTLSLRGEGGPIAMTLLTGTVRAVAGEQRVCRVQLAGEAQAVEALAGALAGEVHVAVPRASLGAEALAIVSGVPPTPRRQGPPELPAGLSVADAFTYAVGHLTDVLLHFAPPAAAGDAGPEPVHQMRVAVRRLRSTIKVFRRALRSPAVDAADADLKVLAGRLAPTRDWDVFVTETGAAVAAAFPAEQRLRRLMAAAERRRQACHVELRAFLLGAEFRRLGITLACLASRQEWQPPSDDAGEPELTLSLEQFAGRVLDKRLKRLEQIDQDIAGLAPGELHQIRLSAKRLRYAVEIFAPLYSSKTGTRYIRRLSRLQDQLGALNDASVAAGLLAELTGAGMVFATGMVLGFVGAHGGRTRQRIDKVWQRFRRLPPFWN